MCINWQGKYFSIFWLPTCPSWYIPPPPPPSSCSLSVLRRRPSSPPLFLLLLLPSQVARRPFLLSPRSQISRCPERVRQRRKEKKRFFRAGKEEEQDRLFRPRSVSWPPVSIPPPLLPDYICVHIKKPSVRKTAWDEEKESGERRGHFAKKEEWERKVSYVVKVG